MRGVPSFHRGKKATPFPVRPLHQLQVEVACMVPSSALAAQTAHLSLVRGATTLRRDDIEQLATALLDLGSGYEAALRTVIAMQRLLERVRRSEEISPESALLLQEMSRQVATLADCGAAMARCVDAASGRLCAMKGDRGE
jgi:hypothetical protein